MTNIPFTQYLRPDGKQVKVKIDRPDEIAQKAKLIIAAGFSLEIEELNTGQVHMTISDPLDDYAHGLCNNGPDVPGCVDKLITEFDIQLGIEQSTRNREDNDL